MIGTIDLLLIDMSVEWKNGGCHLHSNSDPQKHSELQPELLRTAYKLWKHFHRYLRSAISVLYLLDFYFILNACISEASSNIRSKSFVQVFLRKLVLWSVFFWQWKEILSIFVQILFKTCIYFKTCVNVCNGWHNPLVANKVW